MSVDPERASRILDLLEEATRRGDLGKDEAAIILSHWLVEQKRHSSSGSSGSSGSSHASSFYPTADRQPTSHPPLASQRRRSLRGFNWRRLLTGCITADPACSDEPATPPVLPQLLEVVQQPAHRTSRPQTPLPSPPSQVQLICGHEYALYDGSGVSQQPQQTRELGESCDDYEECAAVVELAELLPSTTSAMSNTGTTDSGVSSC